MPMFALLMAYRSMYNIRAQWVWVYCESQNRGNGCVANAAAAVDIGVVTVVYISFYLNQRLFVR